MPRINKTWFAILGLLAWKPMSGYDLKKLIEIGLSYVWHESYGALYPTLERLVDEGYATRREAPRHGRRVRHVYAITAKGRRQVDAWLRRPADVPRSRNELQLKFFLSSRRPPGDAIRLLEEYRRQQLEIRATYAESETILRRAVSEAAMPEEIERVLPGDEPRRPVAERRREALVFLLTLRHGVLMVEARLAWCEEALDALRRAGKEATDVR